jgi:hypothetical protein
MIRQAPSLIIAVALVGACWRSSPPPPPAQPAAQPSTLARRTPPPARDSVIQVMEQLAEDMCACRSSQCAHGVMDEVTRWSQERRKNSEEPPKLSDEDEARAAELGERMGTCLQNAMGTGSAIP